MQDDLSKLDGNSQPVCSAFLAPSQLEHSIGCNKCAYVLGTTSNRGGVAPL
mgnify:CR=1 FL=1